MQTDNYCGIGIGIMGFTQGGTQVALIGVKDTPAAHAGIENGDIVMKATVEGRTFAVNDLRSFEAIRGPQGSRINLTVKKNDSGDLVTYQLSRDLIVFGYNLPVRSCTLSDAKDYLTPDSGLPLLLANASSHKGNTPG